MQILLKMCVVILRAERLHRLEVCLFCCLYQKDLILQFETLFETYFLAPPTSTGRLEVP